MKILSVSDTHGKLNDINLNNIDIAIFAGDIAPLRRIDTWSVANQCKWMNKDFYDFCMSFPKARIFFTPGNHDFFPIAKTRFMNRTFPLSFNVKYAPNATMLIDKKAIVNVEDRQLSIYGTPWVPIISHMWAFEANSSMLKEKFRKIPKNLDILITHTPPNYGMLDVSLEYGPNSQAFGSVELANEIFKKEPMLCFCGHIHSGSHNLVKLGKSELYNVSRVNESYEIAYEPTVLEI